MADALPQPWLGVEQRHLAVLEAVAHHRSFRAAARALGYSQPAISQLVIQLERMLDMPLVNRQAGSAQVALTNRGHLLLNHATAILHSFGAARADLAALAAGQTRVGLLASLAPTLLPTVLRAAGRPAQIAEADDDAHLAALVAHGEIEVAIGELPPIPGPFAVRRLGPDPYVLAVSTEWPLARLEGRPPFELLERLPLIARPGGAAAARLARQLHARGVTPLWGAHADSDAAALALVRSGSGMAVVPHSAVTAWDESTAIISLDGLVPARTICRYVHRDRHVPEDVDVIADAAADALVAATTSPGALHV